MILNKNLDDNSKNYLINSYKNFFFDDLFWFVIKTVEQSNCELLTDERISYINLLKVNRFDNKGESGIIKLVHFGLFLHLYLRLVGLGVYEIPQNLVSDFKKLRAIYPD
jgi:hypothetical protein